MHGRPIALRGDFYVNLFAHYRPKVLEPKGLAGGRKGSMRCCCKSALVWKRAPAFDRVRAFGGFHPPHDGKAFT